ncbi:Rab family GTPase [Roseiflexus castenholzii]|jgi:small GTP-binding protein|uniref:Small GTP-binding protein n=1 Tax=Roseiflexus castenholzii (strain DSM 13941 / HLO8) TaxID=383372 RepID=A7NQ06_ROSCS|nr:Rab family GTPase [Roseiflexus castenholzii]ABU59652.1 small GTP-binding protein [Roseiflexus castenholzii DSM 13941]PJF25236.1 MAG: GTP-binding protein [Phototrophicales bacterium]
MNQIAKVCLIGDFAVGKTSLIRRFTESRFSESYLSTIGIRVSRKILQMPDAYPSTLTLMIWDTAGSEPFTTIVRSYYRGARGAALVCDITRAETVTALLRYAEEFHAVNPDVPLIMIANKIDLRSERMVSDEQLGEIAAMLDAPLFFTSARTGENVEEAFRALGLSIIVKERVV